MVGLRHRVFQSGSFTIVPTWCASLAERQSALPYFQAQQVVERIVDNDDRCRARFDLIGIHEAMTGDGCYCACDQPTSFFANGILAAARNRALLVVPGWYGFHGYAGRQIEEPVRLELRLTRAIMKGHGEIGLEGRAYCIVPSTGWAKEILSRGDWEVMRLPEAKAVLCRMALRAKSDEEKKALDEAAGLLLEPQPSWNTSAGATRLLDEKSATQGGLAALFGEARVKHTADWRPPFHSDGLVLLRRILRVASAKPDTEPAITPSQMRRLVEPFELEFYVDVEEGAELSFHVDVEEEVELEFATSPAGDVEATGDEGDATLDEPGASEEADDGDEHPENDWDGEAEQEEEEELTLEHSGDDEERVDSDSQGDDGSNAVFDADISTA